MCEHESSFSILVYSRLEDETLEDKIVEESETLIEHQNVFQQL